LPKDSPQKRLQANSYQYKNRRKLTALKLMERLDTHDVGGQVSVGRQNRSYHPAELTPKSSHPIQFSEGFYP
jgi:hypothetical protein